MSRLRLKMAMTLDGFVAGPQQSEADPVGVGGLRVFEWVFNVKAWRALQGLAGGKDDESSRVVEESMADIGATIMGRNMFGGHPGAWEAKTPRWRGWWGEDPPFHHPVFVLTHHERDPLEMEGGTTFYFVTQGIEVALDHARRAAGGKDISLAGGAKACQQYLKAGLVDEMYIHLVPVVFGAGERLFDGVDDLHGLQLVSTVPMPKVTHLKFSR